MLVAVNGTVDGVKMGPYVKGAEYDLDDDRARLFIGSAMAEEVVPVVVEEVAEVVEEVSVEEAPAEAVAEPDEAPTGRRRR